MKKILLVEDEPNDIELSLLVLKEQGITNEIVVVHDGKEALDYLLRRDEFHGRSDGNPGLVLLDLKLPKVDGIEVLRTIRFTPALKSIPVVVLTGSALEADVNRTVALGIDEYIVKPMDVKEFIRQMRGVAARFAKH